LCDECGLVVGRFTSSVEIHTDSLSATVLYSLSIRPLKPTAYADR
jgi:hypothetical protein